MKEILQSLPFHPHRHEARDELLNIYPTKTGIPPRGGVIRIKNVAASRRLRDTRAKKREIAYY